MRKATLIRGARQLLTLRGPRGVRRGPELRNLGIIQDGAVLVADGLIREVGPSRRVENLALARGAEEIDASGRVVMPGFVDSHVQPMDVEAQDLSPRSLQILALRVAEDAVRCGTTALEVKSPAALTQTAQLKILRVNAALRELPLTMALTLLAGQAGTALSDRLLPIVRRRKLAEFAELRIEPDSPAADQTSRYLTRARELGFGLKFNAGLLERSGAIAAAVQFGAASIGHVGEVEKAEAALLARSATLATIMPPALFQRGLDRCAGARTLIDHGAAVALASGYHPTDCPSQSMQVTIALACRMLRMTAAEAIVASTINAAHAIGKAASIGSIECGKSADLIMLSVPDFRELPYHLGVNLVDLVMSGGTVLVERSEVQWPAR